MQYYIVGRMGIPQKMQDYQIREVDWQEAQHELRRVREEVFIVEQNVPVELEWDGPECTSC